MVVAQVTYPNRSITQEAEKPLQGSAKNICPRCSSKMLKTYDDECKCVLCGFVDYSSTNTLPSTDSSKNLISSGTKYILRYFGDSKSLINTLAYIKAVRLRNRVIFHVICPFCENSMEQSSISIRRKAYKEDRYKCPQGHQVSVIPTPEGNMAWI
tara:strand:+ start:164 stop:628 length:465 start_codon:yes stop_codon:yes gene_type:complete